MNIVRKSIGALLCFGCCAFTPVTVLAADPQPYEDKLMVPAFVGDVRQFILATIGSHQWTVIDDKPGEVTTQLLHTRQHAKVIAKTVYGKNDLRIEFVSAEPYECLGKSPCGADSETVQRWLVTMRRDYAIELLYAAIQDAGGVVPRRAAAVAPDSESPTEDK